MDETDLARPCRAEPGAGQEQLPCGRPANLHQHAADRFVQARFDQRAIPESIFDMPGRRHDHGVNELLAHFCVRDVLRRRGGEHVVGQEA